MLNLSYITISAFLLSLCLTGVPVQSERTMMIQESRLKTNVFKEVARFEKIENLQSATFPDDFQIQFKNVSDKPIYHISVEVIISNGTHYLGSPFGFRLIYGRSSLIDGSSKLDTDIAIQPGKYGILKVDESAKYVRGYLNKKLGEALAKEFLSKIELIPQIINFGDGTGWAVDEPYPVTVKNKVSLNYRRQSSNALLPSGTFFAPNANATNQGCCCSNFRLKDSFTPCAGVWTVSQVDFDLTEPLKKQCSINIECGPDHAVCSTDYLFYCGQFCPR